MQPEPQAAAGDAGYESLQELGFGSSVPNLPEDAVVGKPTARIRRGTEEFSRLVEDRNPDVVFERGSGVQVSRLMTRRLKHCVDVLAQLVRIEWPSAGSADPQSLLCVLKGWEEFDADGERSTFYEGRTVCVSVIRQGALVGGAVNRIGRLAADAGFDWVACFNSSKDLPAHIHCSVGREAS